MRFTFNLLTLNRFAVIDADRDGTIRRHELDAAACLLQTYLDEHVVVTLNDKLANLGHFEAVECVWPGGKEADVVVANDYAERYVDITFRQQVTPVLADLGLDFAIWQETGPLGTLEATYEQGDLRLQVPFSQSEPDYVYDTGFAVESIFQETIPKPPETPKTSDIPWGRASLLGIVLTAILGWQCKHRQRPSNK